jgi:hypothetical protein
MEGQVRGVAAGEKQSVFSQTTEPSAAMHAAALAGQAAQSSAQLGIVRLSMSGTFNPGGKPIEQKRGPAQKYASQYAWNMPSGFVVGQSRGKRTDKKTGENLDSQVFSDLRLFDAVPKELPFYVASVANQKATKNGAVPAGEMIPVEDPNMYSHGILDGRSDMQWVTEKVDPHGNPIPIEIQDTIRSYNDRGMKIPDQYAPYLSMVYDKQTGTQRPGMAEGLFAKYTMLYGSANGWNSNMGVPTDKLDAAMKAGGYEPATSQDKDYYNKHVTGKLADNNLFTPDHVYKVETYSPVSSLQAAVEATGGDVQGIKEDVNVTSGYSLPGVVLNAASVPDTLQYNKAHYNSQPHFSSTQ